MSTTTEAAATHTNECTECDGLGAFSQDYSRSCHSSDPGSRTCSRCNGTGRTHVNDTKIVPSAACRTCGGWTPFGGMSHHAADTEPFMGRTGCSCGFEDEFDKYKLSNYEAAFINAARVMNASQYRALSRIVRYYRESLDRDSTLWSLGMEIKATDYGTFWVSTQLERLDCDMHSPRNALCRDGGYFSIGRRGAIKVASISKITTVKGWKQHVARMVRGTVG